MIIARNILSEDDICNLAEAVRTAYDPLETKLFLRESAALQSVAERCEKLLNVRLKYFRSFLFLVTDTTMETVSEDSSGWHADSSCALVTGDCFNIWIPLFCESSLSGIEVIEAANNRKLYEYLGDSREPIQVLTKSASQDVFARLGDAYDVDFIFAKKSLKKSIAIKQSKLNISSFYNPKVGDIVIFKQSDIHRGVHQDGIRIQLSIKYALMEANITASELEEESSVKKQMSKHGRLEANVMRTLLGAVGKRSA